jgi:3-(3-hydroxy-phenyl)propionate hydroxylase
MNVQKDVIVAGGGPVGMVTALALAQRDFNVTVVEADAQVDTNPRAATTHSSTLEMLASIGVIDEFIAAGLIARYFDFWDREKGRKVACFDHDLLRNDTQFPFVVQTEQHKLVRIVEAKLASYPNVMVLRGAPVVAVEQDVNGVTVTVERDGVREKVSGHFVIGTDGGRSTVRKSLNIEFEGYTWPEQFLVLTTSFDFEKALDSSYRAYFAGADEWCNLFKVAGDDMKGRWRAVFPAPVDVPEEVIMSDEAAQKRLNGIFQRNNDYELLHKNIYRVHQRVAASFRKGRIFLAGDSSHVNNPIGGLGLNCGIHDALEIANTLAEATDANDPILDRFERRRRTMNVEFVQQQTVANKKRLEERDPAVRAKNLDDLVEIQNDPARQHAFLMRSSLLDSVRKSQAIQ